MKVVAMIPARYASSRFPGKLLKDLCGKPILVRTYETVQEMGLFDDVHIVTDSTKIEGTLASFNIPILKSKEEHDCGSDRLAEVADRIQADIIINVQGDEPFTNKTDLANLIRLFQQDINRSIDLASLMLPITDNKKIENPNNVKVIVDRNDRALYFSRHPIPYQRNNMKGSSYFKHIGIYAFRKQALLDFYHSPKGILEQAEAIECIRHLENGKTIKMIRTDAPSIGIDTPEDLDEAKVLWQKKGE